jgi:hypothetical protein
MQLNDHFRNLSEHCKMGECTDESEGDKLKRARFTLTPIATHSHPAVQQGAISGATVWWQMINV